MKLTLSQARALLALTRGNCGLVSSSSGRLNRVWCDADPSSKTFARSTFESLAKLSLAAIYNNGEIVPTAKGSSRMGEAKAVVGDQGLWPNS